MSLLELGYATSYALEHMTSHAANQPRAVALVQQLAWDDLRIFLALAQSHSTRQAALRIGVNASTISRKLAALEETLGARLVERHPDGLKLTKAGADVVDAALQMNEQVRSLAQRVAGADRRLVGIVRVCAPEILAPSVARALVPMLAEHGSRSQNQSAWHRHPPGLTTRRPPLGATALMTPALLMTPEFITATATSMATAEQKPTATDLRVTRTSCDTVQ